MVCVSNDSDEAGDSILDIFPEDWLVLHIRLNTIFDSFLLFRLFRWTSPSIYLQIFDTLVIRVVDQLYFVGEVLVLNAWGKQVDIEVLV